MHETFAMTLMLSWIQPLDKRRRASPYTRVELLGTIVSAAAKIALRHTAKPAKQSKDVLQDYFKSKGVRVGKQFGRRGSNDSYFMSVNIAAISAACEAHWQRGDQLSIPRNYLRLSDGHAAKFISVEAKEELEREYSWLNYCASVVDTSCVVLPRPLGPLITTPQLVIMVMDYIGGETAEDRIMNGQELSDEDADKVADAYFYLRRAVKPKGDELCPSGSWQLRGHIFKPFGDGDTSKSSRTEFELYMNDRLTQACDGNETKLPKAEAAYVNGDLSPMDVKFLSDGRVALLDHGTAFFGPDDWDFFALLISGYDVKFVQPMLRSLERKGLRIQDDRLRLYEKFMFWHARFGGPTIR